MQKIGTMVYKLELLASSQVHPVFHVSCLKKVIGDKIPVQTILPELDKEGKIILDPKVVTETRIRQLRNWSISEYLIKWKNLPAEDSTWEDEYFIQKHPELLKRWGQHVFEGDRHVRSLFYSYNTYIVIVCPIKAHYCYCCALTLVLYYWCRLVSFHCSCILWTLICTKEVLSFG